MNMVSTSFDIIMDVPSGVYQDQPKSFLKEIDSVDLSIDTGFAVQGKYINPDSTNVQRNISPRDDRFRFHYVFNAVDKYIYTFGVTLTRIQNQTNDYGIKIAVVFVADLSIGARHFGVSIVMGYYGRIDLQSSNIPCSACQVVYRDSVSGLPCDFFPQSNNIGKVAGGYLDTLLKSRGIDSTSALSALYRNPYYSVAVLAHAVAFQGGTLGAVLKDKTAIPSSGYIQNNTAHSWSSLPIAPRTTAIENFGKEWIDADKEEEENLKASKESGGQLILKLIRRLTKKVFVSGIGKNEDGEDNVTKKSVGPLPNGWQWVAGDIEGVQLIARGSNIALMNSLAKEGMLSESVISYMLEQADTFEELAHTYRLIAYSKLPDAQLESVLNKFSIKNREFKKMADGDVKN